MMLRHSFCSLISTVMLLAATLPASAQKSQAPDNWTREEMAMALGQALGIPDFTPPDCVSGQEMFDDVPASNLFCPWIEELARRGITGGCTATEYCPGSPVSRAQMASFLVKTQFPTQVPSGVTVTGRWGFDVNTDGSGDWGTSISYPAPMPATLDFQYLEQGAESTDECPGTVGLPEAAPGWLCVYEFSSFLATSPGPSDNTRFGTTLLFFPEGGGDLFANGTWAATASIN